MTQATNARFDLAASFYQHRRLTILITEPFVYEVPMDIV
ncbi:hypothetical protein AALB_1640 [Agarivorans albus MKT 106]|uniref:Uncharacterized protein n=1 Tax=Agarivorans albus MKT 106 TaxID=1331007 RepID=R9PJN6_AGAAL|nr:hypothetical protein AALB_1640 [Agarivorans albus MKT 106]